MNPFWSRIARELSPYVPGEQPRIADLVKLNTNESPFGPSPLALETMRAAAVDTLRLYPDPEATELRAALAAHHGVKPEQVFASNGSDAVLEHAVLVRHFNKPRTAPYLRITVGTEDDARRLIVAMVDILGTTNGPLD
jgi:histidinol-phosphate aminotransferase